MRYADALPFFLSLISNPLRVSALAPSGKALASAMAADIVPAHAPVLELGPGTGAFTRALLARGVAEEQLVLIEADRRFATLLGVRFPEARILNLDASELTADRFGQDKAGAAVSGLPLLSMSADKVLAILERAFANMRPDGSLYQFTYQPNCPIHHSILDRLELTAHRTHLVLRNLPPAFVFRITRANAPGLK